MNQNLGYATKGRKKILEYLKENSDKTVTISDVLRYLEELGMPKNPSTVYRYMDELVKDGQILKHKGSKSDAAVYQYVDKECHSHLHLQCSGCGKISHLNCDFMHEITGHLNEKHGFFLECGTSMLKGTCENCRENS